MEFKILDTEGRKLVSELLSKTEYNGCEYQYSYECGWLVKHYTCIRYAIEDGIIFIKFQCKHTKLYPESLLFLPPLCELARIETAYKMLSDYCDEIGETMRVIHAPQEHIAIIGDKFICEKLSDSSEYLYAPSDLIDLAGKKYHAKRNHIAKFNNTYKYEFRDYTENDYYKVMQLFDIWQDNKGSDYTREEQCLIYMLRNLKNLNLLACVIEADNRIIAFTLGEISASNVGIVHFEKADVSYNGVYSVINNLFAKKYLSNTRIINRQEDMGIEGLRKAKMSYYPVDMCEKWVVMNNREYLKKLYRDGFPEDTDEDIEYFFNKKLVNGKVFVNDEVNAVAYVFNKKLRYCNNLYKLPYLVAVSVLSEFRGQGKIKELMYQAIEYADERNLPFIALYPFNHDYYKQYGFVTVDKMQKLKISDKTIMKESDNFQLCVDLYNKYYGEYDVSLIRDITDFTAKVNEEAVIGGKLYELTENGVTIGYAIKKGDDIIEGAPFEITDKPNVQMRVANIKRAIESYDFPLINKTVRLKITDEFYRSKTIVLNIENGIAHVDISDTFDKEITIGELTKWLISGADCEYSDIFTHRSVAISDKY